MGPIYFITGIGTGVGKTLAAAILTEALQADYWKPVQAGFDEGTDRQWVQERISNKVSVFHPERYMLKLPASPHLAARAEGISISLDAIRTALPQTDRPLLVEGAGGLLVPLNDQDFMADLALALKASVILVSRNYLGSINHSLLTAAVCRERGLPVKGWIFNDRYGNYAAEIARWSALPILGQIPYSTSCDAQFVQEQARLLAPQLTSLL